MTTSHLSITPPPPFDFAGAARSHGWSALAPNAWDETREALLRAQRLSDGSIVTLFITGNRAIRQPAIDVEVTSAGRLGARQRQEIADTVGHMLRIDEDLAAFYKLCRKRGERWLRATKGLGRVLRSPTVFEDVVKTICTVNIQWGGTVSMVKRLAGIYGEAPDWAPDAKTFPTPQAIAGDSFEHFAKAARLGFRDKFVYELARRVAAGELDLEALQSSDLPTAELKKQLLAIKGVGNYAAANMLMLLGRYDDLAVDTVFRAFVGQKYFAGKYPTDKEAQAIYDEWGEWKYLAYWFDVWEHWSAK